eukprot:6200847-Pleurochrysis_carterae.AAC.1
MFVDVLITCSLFGHLLQAERPALSQPACRHQPRLVRCAGTAYAHAPLSLACFMFGFRPPPWLG